MEIRFILPPGVPVESFSRGWPKGWPVPNVGDKIIDNENKHTLEVDDIKWYPEGHRKLGPFVDVFLKWARPNGYFPL